MIIKELVKFYDNNKSDLLQLGWKKQKIAFVLELDLNGKLVGFISTLQKDGKFEVAKEYVVPIVRTASNSVEPNFLYDSVEYILGVNSKSELEKDEKNLKKIVSNNEKRNASFKNFIDELVEKTNHKKIKAIQTFVNNVYKNQKNLL